MTILSCQTRRLHGATERPGPLRGHCAEDTVQKKPESFVDTCLAEVAAAAPGAAMEVIRLVLEPCGLDAAGMIAAIGGSAGSASRCRPTSWRPMGRSTPVERGAGDMVTGDAPGERPHLFLRRNATLRGTKGFVAAALTGQQRIGESVRSQRQPGQHRRTNRATVMAAPRRRRRGGSGLVTLAR